MNTFPELITKLGGPAVVARAAGKEPNTGRQWNHRGNVPPEYWPALIDLARERRIKGVNADALLKLAIQHAGQRRAAA